jgi:hypothetical protein
MGVETQSTRQILDNLKNNHKIRMVAVVAEVIEREEALVAAACNHPNCLVLPFEEALGFRSGQASIAACSPLAGPCGFHRAPRHCRTNGER